MITIDTNLLITMWPMLLRGAWISLQVAFFGCCIGFSLGTLFGLLQTSTNKLIRGMIGIYVTILRGTPMLIQIAFLYFVLPELGIIISEFWSATIAIGLNSSAYISQIIRSGIGSIPKGQFEAAQVLGLSHVTTVRYIILPQAIRAVLPALGNEFITLIKDSSLASTVGVMDLSKEAAIIRSQTYDVFTTYFAVALIYLAITTACARLLHFLERRMNYHVKN